MHKIWVYCLVAICQLSGYACAYGAAVVAPQSQLAIKLPAGFQINIFSQLTEKLSGESQAQPRMMAFDSQGRLFVALSDTNKVVMLPDANKDGLAEAPIIIASNLNAPNSIAFIDDNTLLIANQDGVIKLVKDGSTWSTPKAFISNLPSDGHTLKTVKIGPDGFLYVNVGSSCNVCVESEPLRATILRYTLQGKPAGSLVTLSKHAASPIWARGLRNSQGFAWQSKTGAMFATNEGADNRSYIKNGEADDDIPPEHLNQIMAGRNYGWPHCWGNLYTDRVEENEIKSNPHRWGMLFQDPNFIGPANFCENATPPAITFDSHSTPIGITFLDKTNFPAEYKNDAIVALHGSWNRKNPSGYKLVRVKFNAEKPVQVVDFATGWLNINSTVQNQVQAQAWGRPVDVIAGPDGALYVSDDRAALIYRISYKQ